ncbi:MAG: cation diffusion facilitator family transporter [Candidatus Sedimenticola endophacoides]
MQQQALKQGTGAARAREVQRVTLVGAVVNLLLSAAKIALGFVAQSQALIADGFHSLSDLLSDALVYVVAKHGHHAPDPDHPYGHGRFETAATLGLGVLLLLVALGIIWDAGQRLFEPRELMRPGVLAIYVALASVLAKEWLYHFTMRVAKAVGSDMLRANAWHHRSDAVSSIVVLVGVAGTLAGLSYLDAIAAIGVGLMIIHVAWEISEPAFQELVDAGLEQEQLERICDIIHSIGGVEALHMLRTRRMGGAASVDVHLLVAPWVSVSEGHVIGQTVIERLRAGIDEVNDVTVHIDPEDDDIAPPTSGLPLRDEATARLRECWHGLLETPAPRCLLLHYLEGCIDVDLHLPLERYTGADAAASLWERLQARLDPHPEFRRLRLFFGECAGE